MFALTNVDTRASVIFLPVRHTDIVEMIDGDGNTQELTTAEARDTWRRLTAKGWVRDFELEGED